jgi:hypothetical protein
MKKIGATKTWKIIAGIILFYSLFIPSLKAGTRDPLIFPIPQQMQVINDVFKMDETVSIILPENAGSKDISLARFLVRELSDKYGIALKIEMHAIIPENRKVVVMGTVEKSIN